MTDRLEQPSVVEAVYLVEGLELDMLSVALGPEPIDYLTLVHSRFVPAAVKVRSTRSFGRAASVSGIVVRRLLPSRPLPASDVQQCNEQPQCPPD